MLPLDLLSKLVERLHVVLAARLGYDTLGVTPQPGRDRTEHGSLVDEIVPDLHVSHLRIAPDALAIRAHDRLSCLLAPSLVAPHKTNGDSGAGSKALEVPFPRPGMDLVEVVDREDEAAFCRSINAEVGNVHVAAAHHLHAGDRSGREI